MPEELEIQNPYEGMPEEYIWRQINRRLEEYEIKAHELDGLLYGLLLDMKAAVAVWSKEGKQ